MHYLTGIAIDFAGVEWDGDRSATIELYRTFDDGVASGRSRFRSFCAHPRAKQSHRFYSAILFAEGQALAVVAKGPPVARMVVDGNVPVVFEWEPWGA